jgi:hypothetical protein
MQSPSVTRSHYIDLRALHLGDPREVARARRQLANVFRGQVEAMRGYYGWRTDAPVLKFLEGV